MRKHVLILGGTGMLGSAVYRVLCENYDVTIAARDLAKAKLLGGCIWRSLDGVGEFQEKPRLIEFTVERATQARGFYFEDFVKEVGPVDWVINCIGMLIEPSENDPPSAYMINGAFPQLLRRTYGRKLINISTDCVFSGTDGGAPYNELSKTSSTSVYGLSKNMGEFADCIQIRTSIIGHELSGGNIGLLGWFLNEAKIKGRVNGYLDHLWNGITTDQFGRICDQIMTDDLDPKQLFHVFSNPVSKCELLHIFRDRFNVDCDIIPTKCARPIDRRLGTVLEYNKWFNIPSIEAMVDRMPNL